VAAFAPGARASGLTLDQWYQFAFRADGGLAISCASAAQRCLVVPGTIQVGPPKWTLDGPRNFDVVLTVTDPFLPVDLFSIINNGRPVEAQASLPTAEPLATTSSIAVCDPSRLLTCVTDPSRHSLTTVFAAGEPIEFEIWVTSARSSSGGSGFFLLTASPDENQVIPEPATWLLLGTGLTLAAMGRRRRAAKA
jgi:hypothetical protein